MFRKIISENVQPHFPAYGNGFDQRRIFKKSAGSDGFGFNSAIPVFPPYHIKSTSDRSKSDNTDFVYVIQVERLNVNVFFFDGLDSGPNTENITLKYSFKTEE
jgi:hypothetical protein